MKPSGDELKADGVETGNGRALEGQESPIGAWVGVWQRCGVHQGWRGRGASLDPPTSHNGFIPLPNPPSPAAWDNILLFFAKDLSTVHKGPDDQFLRLTNSRFSLSFTTFRVNSRKALDIAQDVVFCSEINAHSHKDSKSLQLITVLIITGLNGRPTVP